MAALESSMLIEIIDQVTAELVHKMDGYDIQDVDDTEMGIRVRQFAEGKAKGRAVSSLLYCMGYRLFETYKDEGFRPDLDRYVKFAVACCNEGLDLTTDNPGSRTVLLYRLPEMLLRLYENTGKYGLYLDQSLDVSRELLGISTGPGGEDWQALRTEALEQTATALEHRYAEKKRPRDLYEALYLCQAALRLTDDVAQRASLRSRVAEIHRRRFERDWSLPLIDEAIKEGTAVCDTCRDDNDTRAQALSMLSGYHHSKYEHSHDPSDLKSAVEIARQAVALRAQPITVRIGKDMDEALQAGQEARVLAGADSLSLVDIFSALAELYLVRNARERQLSDAEEAAWFAKRAVRLAPVGVAARLSALSIQLSAMCAKYVRIPETSIREEALEVANEIKRDTSAQDPARGLVWINLGWLHHCQYRETGQVSHLDSAIEAARKAVNLILETNPMHADAEASLGGRLLGLYKRDRSEATLNEAINHLKAAASRVPDSSSARVRHLGHLAAALIKRSEATSDKDKQDSDRDREEAVAMFKSAAANELGTPSDRIGYAQRAIEILVVQGRTHEASALADEAMKLLPLACLRYTCKEDQQHAMMRIPDFASKTASLSLLSNEVEKAVQQLELGRGVILGYAMDDAADLSALRKVRPELAHRYASLAATGSADQVEAYRNSALPVHPAEEWEETLQVQVASGLRDGIAAELAKEQRRAAQELDLCIEEIRQLEGHERFRMPLAPGDWKALASAGPVVMVNMTEIGRHAILITSETVKAIELRDPLRDNAAHHSRGVHPDPRQGPPTARDIDGADPPQADSDMERFSSLWTDCVKPVLEELERMGCLDGGRPERGPPRVWWIGCGGASSLPFHAAGLDFDEGSTNNALRVVSSYTPTLKALAYSRSRALRLSRCPHVDRDDRVVTPSRERDVTSVPGSTNESGSGSDHVKDEPVGDATRTRGELTLPTEAPRAATAGSTSPPESILLVTMPTTVGQRDLPGVDAESAALREACKDQYLIEELRHPTAAQVLDRFVASDIVHFACHGFSDPVYPSESRLMLQKEGTFTTATTKNKAERRVVEDRLRLKDVSRAAFEAGGESRFWLAVLSACSTAETRAMALADEGLHLAAGFQAAGFAHVVGTLWRAQDDACCRVTKHFYTYLNGEAAKERRRDAVVAEALSHAVTQLRRETGYGPKMWAPFVHFGV
ncbi:CHAT domain-containing protein [Chaetomium fimeti]|uniref:CHAT domain-containing protein n=1 Tax=Chaetomium fimeti TaxID=1854472 RepID=A0AAE0H8I3_9PEZI|nr:CHAT domain-containing protein [Chaetomium fimeti]